MGKYKHIDLEEREKIEKFLKKEKGIRWISRRLERSVGSISEEIERNSVGGVYSAKKANHKARVSRKESKIQCMRIAMDPDLKRFVTENIEGDQSPEGISGRLKFVEKDIQYVSTKAIYKFVWSPHGRKIEKHLYSKAVHKKGGPKKGTRVSIDDRTSIDKRPKRIEKRAEFSHFEGDFIESGKDGKGSLLVLVERKTRYPFIRYLEDRTTKSVNKAVHEMLLGIPIESLTIDNDISFQKHKELSDLIEAEIFFCHPQSPHEKGTVENRNKAIRRYVKKRSDLSKYQPNIFEMTEAKLRDKYMKCLNFRSPREEFEKEMKKIDMKKSAICGIIENDISSKIISPKCSA
jgi:transposase, IS30 family